MSLAVPATRRRRTRAAITVADQVVSSLSNVVVMFLAARSMSAADFGLFSVAISVCLMLTMVSRTTLGSRLSFTAAHGQSAVRTETRAALALLVVLAPLVMAVVAVTTIVAAGGWPPTATWLTVAAAPVVLIQDLLRFAASALARTAAALASDTAWLVTLAIVPFILVSTTSAPTTLAVIGSWLVGGAVAAALLGAVLKLGPRFDGLLNWVRASAVPGLQTATGATSRAASGVVRVTLIGALAGAAVVGALTAGQLLMTPLNLLAALIPFGLAPIAARRGKSPSETTRIYALAAGLLSAISLGWGVLCAALPTGVGQWLLGDSWPKAISLIWPMTLMSAAILVATAGFYAHLAAGQTRTYLRVQTAFAALSLAATAAVLIGGGAAPELAWAEAAVVWGVAAMTWAPLLRQRK